jgi:hypothetical protein
MSEKDSFPGPLGAAGLVGAMWLVQLLLGLPLRAMLGADIGIGALVWIGVGSAGIVAVAYLARRRLPLAEAIHPAPHSVAASIGLVAPAVLLVAPAIFVLASFADDLVRLGFPTSDSDLLDFEQMLAGGPLTMFAMVIAGPLFEELLFRGIILRGLLARLPVGRAVFVSALLFGIAHLNIYQLVGGTLVGIPLGWLYVRFRSVLPGVFLHAAMNGLSALIGNLTRADLPASELPLWFLLASLAAFFAGARLLWALTRLRQSGA